MKHYKIFLIGTKDEFQKKDVFSQYDHPNLMKIESNNSRPIKVSITKMMDSDFIVTLDDWQYSDECRKLVQIARIIDIEVVSTIKYQSYVKSKYN